MIRKAKKEEVEQYFETEAVNQSYLKSLLRGVKSLIKDEETSHYEEKGHLIIGSGVDDLLSFGGKDFNEKYHTTIVAKPSPAIMTVVHKVYEDYGYEEGGATPLLQDLAEQILEACDYCQYQSNWKAETRINKILESGIPYFDELIASTGKQVLSKIETDIIDNIAMGFKTHRFTSHYFKDAPHIEIYYQVPIYFTYKDVECKALIDMLIVDRVKETVQPIDFKTTGGDVVGFQYRAKSRGYPFQGAWYSLALQLLIAGYGVTPIPELRAIDGFLVEPFKFMVDTTSYSENKETGEVIYNQGTPIMFTLSYEEHLLAKSGRPECKINVALPREFGAEKTVEIKYQEIKGYEQALELHKWHVENGFELDREVVESNGDLMI